MATGFNSEGPFIVFQSGITMMRTKILANYTLTNKNATGAAQWSLSFAFAIPLNELHN